MSEQEMVLTALHGLRAHKADIETEFSSKPNEDDDESTTQEIAKLIGGAGGAVAGASLGGRYAGLAGSVGGGILGGTVGSTAAGNRDLRRGALAGAGLYAVDRGIRGGWLCGRWEVGGCAPGPDCGCLAAGGGEDSQGDLGATTRHAGRCRRKSRNANRRFSGRATGLHRALAACSCSDVPSPREDC